MFGVLGVAVQITDEKWVYATGRESCLNSSNIGPVSGNMERPWAMLLVARNQDICMQVQIPRGLTTAGCKQAGVEGPRAF